MYHFLLAAHSLVRWFVLITMAITLVRSAIGFRAHRLFSAVDNHWRHWTATCAHIQLILGCYLYFISPLIKGFEPTFFGVIHITMMLAAIVLVTIGSAIAKRTTGDRAKFMTILRWYGIAILLILIAIPWPFSPLAARPLFRSF